MQLVHSITPHLQPNILVSAIPMTRATSVSRNYSAEPIQISKQSVKTTTYNYEAY